MQTNTIKRVFIIDRNLEDAQQQQAIVEDYCASAMVHLCRDAREGVTCLKQYPEFPIDLILLSIDEYHIGGSQFLNLAHMRAASFTYNPVVILTVSTDYQREAFKARQMVNFSDFLHKPIVPEFFEYLMEFHFERDGVNAVKSPSADSP